MRGITGIVWAVHFGTVKKNLFEAMERTSNLLKLSQFISRAVISKFYIIILLNRLGQVYQSLQLKQLGNAKAKPFKVA